MALYLKKNLKVTIDNTGNANDITNGSFVVNFNNILAPKLFLNGAADGSDIRVTKADGITKILHNQRVAFNATTKLCQAVLPLTVAAGQKLAVLFNYDYTGSELLPTNSTTAAMSHVAGDASGCLGAWPLTETGTSFADVSGNGRTLTASTASGNTQVASPDVTTDKAISLGATTLLSYTGSFPALSTYSFSFKIFIPASWNTGVDRWMIDYRNAGATQGITFNAASNGNITIDNFNGATYVVNTVMPYADITAGAWNYFIVSVTPTTVITYLNGIPSRKTTGLTNQTVPAGSNILTVGGFTGVSGQRYCNTAISDVQFYNRVFTNNEIVMAAQGLKPLPGLVSIGDKIAPANAVQTLSPTQAIDEGFVGEVSHTTDSTGKPVLFAVHGWTHPVMVRWTSASGLGNDFVRDANPVLGKDSTTAVWGGYSGQCCHLQVEKIPGSNRMHLVFVNAVTNGVFCYAHSDDDGSTWNTPATIPGLGISGEAGNPGLIWEPAINAWYFLAEAQWDGTHWQCKLFSAPDGFASTTALNGGAVVTSLGFRGAAGGFGGPSLQKINGEYWCLHHYTPLANELLYSYLAVARSADMINWLHYHANPVATAFLGDFNAGSTQLADGEWAPYTPPAVSAYTLVTYDWTDNTGPTHGATFVLKYPGGMVDLVTDIPSVTVSSDETSISLGGPPSISPGLH